MPVFCILARAAIVLMMVAMSATSTVPSPFTSLAPFVSMATLLKPVNTGRPSPHWMVAVAASLSAKPYFLATTVMVYAGGARLTRSPSLPFALLVVTSLAKVTPSVSQANTSSPKKHLSWQRRNLVLMPQYQTGREASVIPDAA